MGTVTPPMDFPRVQQGAVIDGFVVGERVHKGGMSAVWQVTHPQISMPMIMKVPSLVEGEDAAAIVGFEMEHMILPRLQGIHVPKFVAAGDFPNRPYIVMENIEGESLLSRLRDLPLPYGEVASIGAKVAMAIHDLHRQHVIHLDVKPSNVMIRKSGEPALIDFGLSHHDQLPDLLEAQFRVPYGTAPYMAPEQILGVRRDPRSDLFALGVLLYFFSTDVRPFGDPQGKRELRRRLWRDPIPPRKLRKDYPRWLQEIVLRCLEVDPARRHPTAAQLAFDLAHPDQVKLTGRSERLKPDPLSARLRRRFNPDGAPDVLKHAIAAQISTAPIVAVAIDLTEGSEALSDELRSTVRRMLDIAPGSRLACLNVLKQHRIELDTTLDEQGQNKHLKRLVQLKHWAHALAIPEGRITFHVLEATDVAAALVDYARVNHVDQIVLGARTDSALRNILGSVSAEVVAKAPCTVTVVRPRREPDRPAAPLPSPVETEAIER